VTLSSCLTLCNKHLTHGSCRQQTVARCGFVGLLAIWMRNHALRCLRQVAARGTTCDAQTQAQACKLTINTIIQGSTTFDRRYLTAGRLAAGHLTVRHLTPSRFYCGQLTANACKRIVTVTCLSVCLSIHL